MRKVGLILGLVFILLTVVPTYRILLEVGAEEFASRAYKVSSVNIDTDDIDKPVYASGPSPFPVYTDISVEHHLLIGDKSFPITSIKQYKSVSHSSLASVTYERSYHFHNQDVEIMDTFQGGHIDAVNQQTSSDQNQSIVHVLVNGKDYTFPVKIPVRLDSVDDNRYWGYLGFGMIDDGHGKQFAIIERVSDGDLTNDQLKWRIIRVGYDGLVHTENFSYPERSRPAYRTMLMNTTYVQSSPTGFYSDVLAGYPVFWYPFIYPLGMFVVGVLLTTLTIRKGKKANR